MAVNDWYREIVGLEEIEPDLSVDVISEPFLCYECDEVFFPKRFVKKLCWDNDRWGNESPAWKVSCICPKCATETDYFDKIYDVDEDLAREFYIDTYGTAPMTEEEEEELLRKEYFEKMSDYAHSVLVF